MNCFEFFFFFQAEDGIRDYKVTGVQTCALPISPCARPRESPPAAAVALGLAETRVWSCAIESRRRLAQRHQWSPDAWTSLLRGKRHCQDAKVVGPFYVSSPRTR